MPVALGDNPTSAGNQQERLIQLGWVIGFVDGEGCFSLGFVRQPCRAERKGYKTGYQVFHEFAVTQGDVVVRVLTVSVSSSAWDRYCRIGGTVTTKNTCIGSWCDVVQSC